LTLLVLLAAGCVPDEALDGDDPAEDGPTATGEWSGGVTDLTFELILVELERGELSGTGTVRGASGAATVAVRMGSHRHPNISLTLGSAAFEAVTLSGAFKTDDEIRGRANGSGLRDQPFVLVRQ
jgi:hypothetical protein